MARALRPISHEDRLTLVDHLDELRRRLIISVVTLVAAFAFCFWQNNAILDIVTEPYRTTQNLDQPSDQSKGPARAGCALFSSSRGRRWGDRARAGGRPLDVASLRSEDNLSAAQRRQIDSSVVALAKAAAGRRGRRGGAPPHAAQPRDAGRHRAVHRDDHGRLLRGAAARDADAPVPEYSSSCRPSVRASGASPCRSC